MPRSSRSSRPSAPARAPAPVQSRPPPPPAPMPQQQSGGMLSGLGSTIAQGFAFGTGSAIAHRAVGAVANSFGGSEEQVQQPQQNQYQVPLQQPQTVCIDFQNQFNYCMQRSNGNVSECQDLFNELAQCQQNARF